MTLKSGRARTRRISGGGCIKDYLPKKEQAKLSRSFRDTVRESCGVSLLELWSCIWYKNTGRVPGMVKGCKEALQHYNWQDDLITAALKDINRNWQNWQNLPQSVQTGGHSKRFEWTSRRVMGSLQMRACVSFGSKSLSFNPGHTTE
jgi:hypothetical protein